MGEKSIEPMLGPVEPAPGDVDARPPEPRSADRHQQGRDRCPPGGQVVEALPDQISARPSFEFHHPELYGGGPSIASRLVEAAGVEANQGRSDEFVMAREPTGTTAEASLLSVAPVDDRSAPGADGLRSARRSGCRRGGALSVDGGGARGERPRLRGAPRVTEQIGDAAEDDRHLPAVRPEKLLLYDSAPTCPNSLGPGPPAPRKLDRRAGAAGRNPLSSCPAASIRA